MRGGFIFLGVFVVCVLLVRSVPLPLTGVNEATAGFGNTPGVYGVDYIYPDTGSVDYFVSNNFNVFRVPFMWERLQPTLFSAFDAAELGRLSSLVSYMHSKPGVYVLLDPHNYARYQSAQYGQQVIGTSFVPNTAFVDLWTRLATLFGNQAGYDRVIFGLMNEPNSMPTEQWVSAAQDAINGIRGVGSANLILVPGNSWTGAYSWTMNWYGTSNAQAMLGITDPLNNYAFEVHQYFNADGSGSTAECVAGVERMTDFTAWARANGKKAFLGEFAGGNSDACSTVIESVLSYMETNRDVYIGWTWWAAGPWWGDYRFSIEPLNGAPKPQMAWLTNHLNVGGSVVLSKAVAAGLNTTGSSEEGQSYWIKVVGVVSVVTAAIIVVILVIIVIALIFVVKHIKKNRRTSKTYEKLNMERISEEDTGSYKPPHDL